MPGDVAVDVRAREVFDAGPPERLRRAAERVPHEVVDAVDERVVSAALQRGGPLVPVVVHVRERLGGGARESVDSGGVGGGHVVGEVGMVRGSDGPELALRHVVHAEEGKLVRLQKYARVAVPGTAGLGVDLDAARVREATDGAVEAVAEEVVAHAAEVLHHLRVGAESGEHGEVGAQGVACAAEELFLEACGPGGNCAFPAHGIDVRERGADERPQLLEEVAGNAVEVARHRVGVDYVDVELAFRDGAVAEAQRHLASAWRIGGEKGDGRLVAVAFPAVHDAARIAPTVLHFRVGRHDHLDDRDVRVVLEVGGDVLRVHSADEPLGAVGARLPRTLQGAAAVGEVHGEREAEARALLHGERHHLPPFGAAEGELDLWLPNHLVVAARVEHQHAAEADLLHGLQVGRDGLAVDVAVHPVPVAPWARRVGRRAEVVVERRRERRGARRRSKKQNKQFLHGE